MVVRGYTGTLLRQANWDGDWSWVPMIWALVAGRISFYREAPAETPLQHERWQKR